MFKPTPLRRATFFIFFDILLSLGTLFLAYNLRFNFSVDAKYLENFLWVFGVLVLLKTISIGMLNLYTISWRFFSLSELKKLFYAHLVAYPLVVMVYYMMPDLFSPFPRSVLIIDLFLSILFLGFFRTLKRLILEGDSNKHLKKTLIIGANTLSQTVIKERTKYYVTAVVDDDENLINTYFSNIKIKSMQHLSEIIHFESIESVVITKELQPQTLNSIYDELKQIGVKEIKLMSFEQQRTTLKDLSVEDLLARNPKDLNKELISTFIKDKVVLVTGAGGSIGSEICRQCEIYGARKLILVDNSEFNLYSITETLKNVEIVSVMQNILDTPNVKETFKKHKPQIVIHAAAYKHVPLVEENIQEAINNNIIGTKNIVDLSIEHGVEKFVFISSDKAVRPTNVMGTTKRICELYASNVDSKSTEIVSVRFGNVLGSSGSVIPKFKSQIEAGGPLTVTHPDITRYFMLISEACELVLQAASIGEGSEIFILDMGESVKIVDLAKKMIELSARDDIEIAFTGLRKGEKLYEELLLEHSDSTTEYESITVAKLTKYEITSLNKDIQALVNTEDKLSKLKEIVPEFNHQTNL